SDSDGSAQSVHSRAILKLPRSKSRRISMSLPARRRFLSTSNRWPRNGWKGWRISTHPKGELGSSAVRTDRPHSGGSVNPTGGATGSAKAVGADVLRQQLWIPAGTVAAWCGSPSTEVPCGRLWLVRSEEHTSELQSLTNLVCRLLLEKKKKKEEFIARAVETIYMTSRPK